MCSAATFRPLHLSPPTLPLHSNIFQICVYSLSPFFFITYLLSNHSSLASTPIIAPALLSQRSVKNHLGAYVLLASPSFLKHFHVTFHNPAHLCFCFCFCLYFLLKPPLQNHSPLLVHLMSQFSMLNPKLSCFALYSCPRQSNLWPCLQSPPLQTILMALSAAFTEHSSDPCKTI